MCPHRQEILKGEILKGEMVVVEVEEIERAAVVLPVASQQGIAPSALSAVPELLASGKSSAQVRPVPMLPL